MGYTLAVTVWRIATLLGFSRLTGCNDVTIFVTVVCAEALEEPVDLRVAEGAVACWCSAGNAPRSASTSAWSRRWRRIRAQQGE